MFCCFFDDKLKWGGHEACSFKAALNLWAHTRMWILWPYLGMLYTLVHFLGFLVTQNVHIPQDMGLHTYLPLLQSVPPELLSWGGNFSRTYLGKISSSLLWIFTCEALISANRATLNKSIFSVPSSKRCCLWSLGFQNKGTDWQPLEI